MFLMSDAFAQAAPAAAPAAQGGSASSLIMLVPLFLLMYFMVIRPQMKRSKEQKKLVEKLAKGDEVLTIAGIVGKIIEVREQYVVLELSKANNTTLLMQKTAIQSVLPTGTMKGL